MRLLFSGSAFIVALICAAVMGVAWIFSKLVTQCRRIDAYIDDILSEVL